VFAAAYPAQLAHFSNLRSLPVNQAIGADVARQRIIFYLFHIREGFALLTDTDLGRKLPTAFVPAGETLMTLLLGNLEHLTNHKYQLFMYLKLMGVEVSSRDLYQFR
jgi:hypothetical protein